VRKFAQILYADIYYIQIFTSTAPSKVKYCPKIIICKVSHSVNHKANSCHSNSPQIMFIMIYTCTFYQQCCCNCHSNCQSSQPLHLCCVSHCKEWAKTL